jgi:hypothetical protein
MNYEEEMKNSNEVILDSAIPSMSINETKFIAKGQDRYLIVFVDMVKSTNTLRIIDGDMDEVTNFFKHFHEKTIGSFRERFSNSFKFKMLGDGILFFYKENIKSKCRRFHRYSMKDLNVRTVAGYGMLIEVDVGLDNKWTDYYGVAINDIVHASKGMDSEFKWIEE